MIRVLVVDDQAMVRAGFAALLGAQSDIEVVGEAADGEAAVEAAARWHPDVILMDVRMPVLDGLAATRAILAEARLDPPGADGRDVAPRIVMLTTFDIDDHVHEALRSGASGFLLKDSPPTDLVEAVRVVSRGDALLAPSVTRRLIERFTAGPGGASSTAAEATLVDLTNREREVLVEIGRGRSNREIAAALYIAEQTVKTHVSRVLGKLGLRDRAQAVVVAYETGLIVAGAD